MQWLEEARRDAGGLESLSDFISLPRDEEDRPIIPTPRVTALVEAKEAWATELGHARRCAPTAPFDHTGAARHATHCGAVAANGAA